MSTERDKTQLATVGTFAGRYYLKVAGIVVAMQGDPCRDGALPEDVLDPIPADELESATIGDKRASELPIKVVRFFRGDCWTLKMLEYVADTINATALATARAEEERAGRVVSKCVRCGDDFGRLCGKCATRESSVF